MRLKKGMANPRGDGDIYHPRTQEFTGGHNPRQVLDLEINPNEDNPGLSHHARHTTEDSESRAQRDPDKRRERALLELAPAITHIDIKPNKMDDMIERSPRFEEENRLLESGLGVDLGANGLSLSAGAHRGSVRSDTPYVTYGRSATFGKTMEIALSDLSKARRRYKGRKYTDDEEDDEEEKKGKRSNKRKKKRSGLRGRKKAGGRLKGSNSRNPKRTTATVAGAARRSIGRGEKDQVMDRGKMGRKTTGSTSELSLKYRDPIAYARKLANEKMRRQSGAMPRAMTHHRSSEAGVSSDSTRGSTIGGTKTGKGTRLPSSPNLGTNMSGGKKYDQRFEPGTGDPLGTEDPLKLAMEIVKASGGLNSFSRIEMIGLKVKIEKLLKQLEKLTKSSPELEENAKRGARASDKVSTAPTGATKLDDGHEAWMFEDPTALLAAGIVGKR